MDPNELKAKEMTSDTIEINTTLKSVRKESVREIVAFVGSASKIDAHAIGFLTHLAYQNAHYQNRIIVLRRNNDLCGFILYSLNKRRECRILQIWVRADARIFENGRALIAWLENNIARPHNSWCVRCWCAEDLESNLFWNAMGFENPCWRWGPAQNPRRHKLWIKKQPTDLQSLLAATSLMHEA